jgi:nucleotide-binding universal stress UspA family protein
MAYRKILVGTDGSPPSLKGVRDAAELAKAMDAELIVLVAYEPVDQATLERWKDEAPVDIAWRFTGTALAEQSAERGVEAAKAIGAKARGRIDRGEPAETLIQVAEEEGADLIVMGNRGMQGTTRFLLGSVPNKVSHTATCDVLIAKTT